MKFFGITVFLITLFEGANAQYYYQDITGTRQTNQQYKLLQNFGTKKITATSYDGDELLKDFVLEQTISADGKQIMTRSASINNDVSFFISTFALNRVTHTVDSSKNAINTVDYTYDNSGKIMEINSGSKDFDGTYTSTENHTWSYNEKGQPGKMIKVKNGTDTTTVTFACDENENVSEERWEKKGRLIETYYYYYNAKKQLTDIVRFSPKAGKLLPDFMFEYDNTGHLSQMIQRQDGIANYLIWKYAYNTDGLKIKETAYNKKREEMGRIEYRYR